MIASLPRESRSRGKEALRGELLARANSKIVETR